MVIIEEMEQTILWIWQLLLQKIWEAIIPLGALGAAIGACLTAYKMKRIEQMRFFTELLSEYSSPSMENALKTLGDIKERKDEDSEFWKDFVKFWKENRKKRSKIYKEYPGVSEARRRVSHHYTTALELYLNKKCINKRFLEIICQGDGFKRFLFGVVEHLEQALNPEYARWQFDKLLELSGLSEKEMSKLQRTRPPKKLR